MKPKIINVFTWLSPFLYSREQSSRMMRGFLIIRLILEWVTSLLIITPFRTHESSMNPPGTWTHHRNSEKTLTQTNSTFFGLKPHEVSVRSGGRFVPSPPWRTSWCRSPCVRSPPAPRYERRPERWCMPVRTSGSELWCWWPSGWSSPSWSGLTCPQGYWSRRGRRFYSLHHKSFPLKEIGLKYLNFWTISL